MVKVPRHVKSQKNGFMNSNPKSCKEGKTTEIIMNSGSTLYLIESEHSCTIRFIQKMMDSSEINDNEFRHYVRTMISPRPEFE